MTPERGLSPDNDTTAMPASRGRGVRLRRPGGGWRRAAAAVLGLSVLAGAVVMALRLPPPAVGRAVALHERSRALPAFSFEDGEGRERALVDWRGRVVVLNVWATWCGPCRDEMPSLDRMRAALGDAPVELVALSVDQGGTELIRRYYRDNGLDALEVYRMPFDAAEKALALPGIPVTLIVDREGNEAGRVIGEAAWDRPEVIQMLKRLAERPPGAGVDPPAAPVRFPVGIPGR